MRIFHLTAAVVLALPILSPIAAGATPPSSTPSTIALAAAGTSNVAQPTLGSTVAFTTTYANTYKGPRVNLNCYQNGTLVWGTLGLVTDQYKLGGDASPWVSSGGPATCVADLVNVTWKGGVEYVTWMASTNFTSSG